MRCRLWRAALRGLGLPVPACPGRQPSHPRRAWPVPCGARSERVGRGEGHCGGVAPSRLGRHHAAALQPPCAHQPAHDRPAAVAACTRRPCCPLSCPPALSVMRPPGGPASLTRLPARRVLRQPWGPLAAVSPGHAGPEVRTRAAVAVALQGRLGCLAPGRRVCPAWRCPGVAGRRPSWALRPSCCVLLGRRVVSRVLSPGGRPARASRGLDTGGPGPVLSTGVRAMRHPRSPLSAPRLLRLRGAGPPPPPPRAPPPEVPPDVALSQVPAPRAGRAQPCSPETATLHPRCGQAWRGRCWTAAPGLWEQDRRSCGPRRREVSEASLGVCCSGGVRGCITARPWLWGRVSPRCPGRPRPAGPAGSRRPAPGVSSSTLQPSDGAPP
ncbi:PREDICTED: basic proline-rich protein-like [Condylura cristata]|uniref:basic proline-rich protein-like n=1 Tax=Condylura cristata TaxID=143302 RepID=UPI000643E6CA|nr:PREDICTED: basic proline-rich protein-like [Condylura cristata]